MKMRMKNEKMWEIFWHVKLMKTNRRVATATAASSYWNQVLKDKLQNICLFFFFIIITMISIIIMIL